MYETPKLISVGKGENVILGVMNSGWDIDGLYIQGGGEFSDDLDANEL
jgi:hypothetical protein